MRKTHHVVHDPSGGWNVKVGGGERAIKHFDRKSDAVDFGREVSRHQHSEFVIHGRDGLIQNADSHGGDPNPPKDTK